MTRIVMWPAAIAVLAWAGSLRAHHSLSMIDTSVPVWVRGTVVSYEPISPHAMVGLEERTEDGQVRRWTIEGPFPGRLDRILSLNRMGAGEDLLEVGDVIEVCGFYPKGESAASLRVIHGHVLVMPDGRMQSWGPYGKTDNCVRPNDANESWIEFLDSDPLARDLWCGSRAQVLVESVASDAFVAAVTDQMANPCR